MLAQNWIKVCGMTATCAMLYSSVVFMGQIAPGGIQGALADLSQPIHQCDPVNDLSGCNPV